MVNSNIDHSAPMEVAPVGPTNGQRLRENVTKRKTFRALFIVAVFTILYDVKFYGSVRQSEAFKRFYDETVRPYRCKHIFNTRNKATPVVAERPPWFDLTNELNSTSNSTEILRIFYLTAGNLGRLGNQLFCYASLFGIAWRSSERIPLWNDDRQGLRKIFKQLRIDASHTSHYMNFTRIDEANRTTFNKAVENLPPTNIHLNGYLQSTRHFAHVEDQLRHEFTFSPDVMRQAQRKLDAFNASSLRENGYVRVVIHVRRGDYSRTVDRLLDGQPKYFNRSMAYFTDCLPKVHFIVLSDNITWCRQHIFGHKVDFIDGERAPAVDLAIASLCDHAIITYGTFGWWAAWFSGGVTLRL